MHPYAQRSAAPQVGGGALPRRRRRGRAGVKRYTPLLRFFARKRYHVVDAMAALDGAGRDRPIADLVPSHYSPLANQLVAEQLLQRLRALGLVP